MLSVSWLPRTGEYRDGNWAMVPICGRLARQIGRQSHSGLPSFPTASGGCTIFHKPTEVPMRKPVFAPALAIELAVAMLGWTVSADATKLQVLYSFCSAPHCSDGSAPIAP